MNKTPSVNDFSRQTYFPTMVYTATAGAATADLNAYLLEQIYAERDRDNIGIQRSNFTKLGSWHSHNHLHRSDAFKPLVNMIHQFGQHISEDIGYDPSYELTIGTMWAIINPPGASNRAHIHPDCQWSGVYYVQTPANSGHIEFIDPRTQHLMRGASFVPDKRRLRECWTKVNYKPIAEKMLVFPAWLYHAVHPNLSTVEGADANRVIISFNISQRRRA